MDRQHEKRSLTVGLASLTLVALACALLYGPGQPEVVEPSLEPPEVSPTPAEQSEAIAPKETPAAELPGVRVVYNRFDEDAAGDTVWVWTEGETPVQVSSQAGVTKVALSDDGQVIAYVRAEEPGFRGFELWTVNADGSNEQLLVSTGEFRALLTEPQGVDVGPLQIQWLPGTHTLAYNTSTRFNAPGSVVNGDLRLVDVDTLDKSVLLEPGTGGRFHYSPDGTQIALVTPTSISLVDADGGNLREDVLTLPEIGMGESLFYARPVWSPDSSRLLVTIPPEDLSAALSEGVFEETTIWEIPVDGSAARELGRVEAEPVSGPSLSPNLSRMAFLRHLDFEDDELHVANPDGSGDSVYDTAGRLVFLGWAPDSQRFVYLSGETTLKVGRVGEEAVTLGDAPIIPPFAIQWVDDDRFLYVTREGPEVQLWLSGPSDTGQMVDSMSYVYLPAFDSGGP